MAVRLEHVSALLRQRGVRHHLDADQGVIRLVFTTQTYRNLRDERMVIVTLSTPQRGRIIRGVIDRAFAVGADAARSCGLFCSLAADTPLVGVEHDRDSDALRMVVESCVEDGRLTARQIVAMIDRLVEAAEVWAVASRLAIPRTDVAGRPHGGREQGAA